uniref:Ubiquitin-like domain-containing protein n=1 Tax=Hyaloperonospora arabidopsidis (strain Emoy2) TaxID=559515 RepID=M4BWZ5_HYAAE
MPCNTARGSKHENDGSFDPRGHDRECTVLLRLCPPQVAAWQAVSVSQGAHFPKIVLRVAMEDSSAASPLPLVSLVVRNVYTPSQALALTVDARTLVGELKRRLSVEFPSRPSVESQKLIFGGKVCSDDETLAHVLVQMQSCQQKESDDQEEVEPVVLHLLVHATSGERNKHDVQVKAPVPEERHDAQDSPRPRTRREPVSEPLSFRVPPEVALNEAPAASPLAQHEQLNVFRQSMLMQQQMLVLQQIQYLQCLQLQQRHQHAVNNAVDVQQPFGAFFVPPYGNYYGMMQPPMGSAPAAQGPVNVSDPAHTQTPAAPAAEAAAAPQERLMHVEMVLEAYALLDFRMALKMAFMLFIIGQDTPVNRVLLLMLLAFVSYLHITGILAKVYEIYNRRRRRNGVAAPDEQAIPNAQGGAAAGAGAAIANRYGTLLRVLRISAERGFVHDVKYFVVGLLLSLVPAWHPQPNQGAAPVVMPDDVPLQEM